MIFRFLSFCALGVLAQAACAQQIDLVVGSPQGAPPRAAQKVRTDVYVVQVDDKLTGQRSVGVLRIRDRGLTRLSSYVQAHAAYLDAARRELLFIVEDARDGATLEQRVLMRPGETRTWMLASQAVRLTFEAAEYR